MRPRIPLLLCVALIATAVPYGAIASQAAPPTYDVTITRTEYGIPHIVGKDYASAGYGFGYAFAQDNICTMAEGYITVRAQRSKYFGPDNTYFQAGNGVTTNNLKSDIFWQHVKDDHIVDELISRPVPKGPAPEVKQAVKGYVAGYNRYLTDVGGTNGLSDPTCKGKPWVLPITTDVAYLRFYQLILLASQDVIIDGIADAAPPPGGLATTGAPMQPADMGKLLATNWHKTMGGLGSNAVGIGKGGSRDKQHGVLLGNPHFPYSGTERFYQAQITIPGVLNVAGAALFGVPIILIGYNSTMAWSHTVSTAFRFTPYQLTLVPGLPTTYLQDGVPTKMVKKTVTVQGQQHDIWWTRYGPVFTSLIGVPLPWTPTTAFAMRDANVDNFRVFNHFLETAKAKTAQDMLGVLKKYQGIPWVNTIVADKNGSALYADIGAIPNVTDDKAHRCNTAVGQATFAALGLPILDGSRVACDWGTDPDAIEPGLFGPSHLPYMFRNDYVTNSNDSYWLANPKAPLEGFSRIIGTERTERSLRTRIGLTMTQGRVDGTDGNGPAGFTVADMQNMVFNDATFSGVLLRDDLVKLCRKYVGGTIPTSDGSAVAVGNACTVLANWDLKENVDSKGAILFRRWYDRAGAAAGGVGPTTVWRNPFDANNPVNTPNHLRMANPQATAYLGDAIKDLRDANLPLDVSVGSQQYVEKNGVKYPFHGGVGDPNGNFNAIWTSWDSGTGVTRPEGGSSYVQAVTWDSSACPIARSILTYSLSTDSTSAHYADQTALFSNKGWVTNRFCAADIAASPVKQVVHLTA
ncbi:MAG: acyl-homoserine-lactone acylase [Frankiales bacterium]|jgi:acyl-homoserine-lactone acylase|nr:acyl-homoserine-lactone acylase [Frankiales bacterium]